LDGRQPVSPQDIAALLWRHAMAVAVIFVLAAGLAYHADHANPGFVDTATVGFTPPSDQGLFTHVGSLLVIDALTTNTVMSAGGQRQVRDAGGTAEYDVTLINLNDEDYPDYGEPYVTVATTSPNPGAASDTMSAVVTVLGRDLSKLQAQQGAPPGTQISLRTIAAPSGPVAQTGSRKRFLAGLAVLALIAAYMAARFLDRHPVRLRDLLRKADRTGTSPGASRRFPAQWPDLVVRPSLWRR
jgi:hypothetical protein